MITGVEVRVGEGGFPPVCIGLFPVQPLDDPEALGSETVVVVFWNEVKWPSGHRFVNYLTTKHLHPSNGSALFSAFYEDAELFTSRHDAETFLAVNAALRGHEYRAVEVLTVGELRARVGYPEAA